MCNSVYCTGEIFIRDHLARDGPSLIRRGVIFVLLYPVNIFAGVYKSLEQYPTAMDSLTSILKCQWTKVYVDVMAVNGHLWPVAYHFDVTQCNSPKHPTLRRREHTRVVYWSIWQSQLVCLGPGCKFNGFQAYMYTCHKERSSGCDCDAAMTSRKMILNAP